MGILRISFKNLSGSILLKVTIFFSFAGKFGISGDTLLADDDGKILFK